MRRLFASILLVLLCGCTTDSSHRIDPVPAGGHSGGSGGSPEPGGSAGSEPGGDGDGDGGGARGGDMGLRTFDELVGTAEGRNDVPAGEVCARIATIQCAGEASCCEAPGRDFESCKATMQEGCVRELFLDGVTRDPIAGYDQQLATSVFAEFEDRARRCDLAVAEWGASTNGLRAITRGTLPAGAACQPNPLDIISPGAKAAAFLVSCEGFESQACLPKLAGWSCAPREALGGPCFSDMNCVEGLYCTNSKSNPSLQGGTCQARKADGESCSVLTDCASTACKGDRCVARTRSSIFCLQ